MEGVWIKVEELEKLKQQAERIKELEAAMPLYDELLIRCAIAEKDISALRQRIADAPVVAWVIRNSESDMKGWIPAKMWADGEFQYPLISKEDLQK